MSTEYTRHLAVLEKLGLANWSEYDLPAIDQAFVERSPRHLKTATYQAAGLSISCPSGLYHPDVNSSTVFVLRHLLDKTLFAKPAASFLEIGTGSGAIIMALQQFLGDGEFIGVDIDPESVACAKINAVNNNMDTRFIESDLFSGTPGKKYDVIIFNYPLYGGVINDSLAQELRGKLCDYRGALLARFMEELPDYLADKGQVFLTISNTSQLAALDQADFAIEVIAFERYATGFIRILTRLTRANHAALS